MHVKDATHKPPLYSTILYLLEPRPPFRFVSPLCNLSYWRPSVLIRGRVLLGRIMSISPKLCLSDVDGVELPISARCALQVCNELCRMSLPLMLSFHDVELENLPSRKHAGRRLVNAILREFHMFSATIACLAASHLAATSHLRLDAAVCSRALDQRGG